MRRKLRMRKGEPYAGVELKIEWQKREQVEFVTGQMEG
jgi:hypothetical protein